MLRGNSAGQPLRQAWSCAGGGKDTYKGDKGNDEAKRSARHGAPSVEA